MEESKIRRQRCELTLSNDLNRAERRVLTLSTFETFVDCGFRQAAEAYCTNGSSPRNLEESKIRRQRCALTLSDDLNRAERRVLTLSTFETFVDRGFGQAAVADSANGSSS